AYFYFNPDLLTDEKINLNSKDTVEIIMDNEAVPPKPDLGINSIPENARDIQEEPVDEVIRETLDNPTARAEEKKTDPVRIEEPAEELSLPEKNMEHEVVVPDMEDEFEDAPDLDMDELAGDNLNKLNPVREDLYSKTEVRTLRHKKYDFHYELNEGTLTLYGNFEEIPYEILEINSSDGKRLFLNYRNNYYMLLNTHEISALNPITDTTLIRELDIVKNNK
ncbi:MAG: hypothetical protein KFF73_05490, partial [Cyclobacteriaceae bacterium]|nr:hypothetical protein [Cyclobacteriaceae bacterium]